MKPPLKTASRVNRDLLLRREQLVAPVHRLAQRLVARGRQPPPGHEEAEPVGKPRLDLRERQRFCARRGQLYRAGSPSSSAQSLRRCDAASSATSRGRAARARARKSETASEARTSPGSPRPPRHRAAAPGSRFHRRPRAAHDWSRASAASGRPLAALALSSAQAWCRCSQLSSRAAPPASRSRSAEFASTPVPAC